MMKPGGIIILIIIPSTLSLLDILTLQGATNKHFPVKFSLVLACDPVNVTQL